MSCTINLKEAVFVGLLIFLIVGIIYLGVGKCDRISAKAYNLGYNQGFALGKVAGVSEDMKNAENYIKEYCECTKRPEK